jgi:hypothetical protein
MNFSKNNLQKICLAILPVFLLLPNFSIATNPPNIVSIVLELSSDKTLPSLSTNFGLTNVRRVFDNPKLGLVYAANIDESKIPNLTAAPGVDYVNLDHKLAAADVNTTQAVTANDPYFATNPTDTDKQWYLQKIQVPQAWQYYTGSNQVTVAVLDTGIHVTHIDLNDGRVVSGYDELKQQDIPANTNSDDNGHGTIVAGVIGAVPNNSIGIAGINWQVRLMPVKVLDAAGNGTISSISSGIIWATDHGANIINMSLGGSGFPEDQTLAQAITYAFNKNVLIVSAAGNDLAKQGLNLDQTPAFPVCADNGSNMVLGVAATDSNDAKAVFSDFGINCVDLTAPGVHILSTAYLPSQPSDNLLIYGDGTSLAAPMVSGVAALIKSAHPTFTNAQIRDLMMSSADDITPQNQNNCLGTSCSGFLGKGRLNALKALKPQPVANGAMLRDLTTGKIYLVQNNTKQYISMSVFSQRGLNLAQVLDDNSNVLPTMQNVAAMSPLEGTLIKSTSDPTVYVINGGVKRPLTYLVFVSRKYKFSDVVTFPGSDVADVPSGDWYWPPDGTLVLIKGNPTVYVMDQQVARPVTYFVFTQRKLSFKNVITVSNDEFTHVPRPLDNFWLAPLDGTLVKSKTDSTVFVIQGSTKHALSGPAFTSHGYKFGNIKVLPQAEVDVIFPGDPILQ